jgi:hypothetical protein
VAAPTVGATPAVRLLVRLDELGSFDAERALERVLERRFLLRAPKCVAPTKAAIAAADAELDDFFVLEEQKPPRAPTPQERSDLAYFHAAVDGAAGWIGSLATVPGQLLQDDHPDVTLRKNLDAELTAALARGDVEEHAKLAPRYLASLGYPGPVRAQEDAAPGTRGYGDIMRDLARSLEILGRLDEAAALYRLPVPFRGCTMSTLDDELQIRGIIRTSEGPSGDCRRSAAMRLYAVDGIRDETYGVEALEAGGYDVARLYRAALATQGRQDADEVKRRLEGSPHASAGLTRLTRLGAEPWLKDLRALRGYADAAGAAALDTLLDLAEHGSTDAREEALEALAALADDDGTDPCSSTGGRWRFSGDRKVRRLSERCETKLPAADSAALATRLAGFAKDPSPQVREHVAAGRSGEDDLRAFPVRRAAKEGLERLAAAEKNRAAAKSTKKSAKGEVVEVPGGDDVLHLREEVFAGALEHLHRELAGVELGPRLIEDLEHLLHRRQVELGHLLLHHRRGERLHPGQPAEDGGHARAALPARLTCRWSTLLVVIASSPQKVKNTNASMPDWRAALPRMSAGYTSSRPPCEQMIATLRLLLAVSMT